MGACSDELKVSHQSSIISHASVRLRADHLSVGSVAEVLKDSRVDRVLDELDRAVAEKEVHAARMPAGKTADNQSRVGLAGLGRRGVLDDVAHAGGKKAGGEPARVRQ